MSERPREPFVDEPLACEDCGESIPVGRRRVRCPHCKQLVCGWCYNHVHGLERPAPVERINENG